MRKTRNAGVGAFEWLIRLTWQSSFCVTVNGLVCQQFTSECFIHSKHDENVFNGNKGTFSMRALFMQVPCKSTRTF